MRPTRSFAAVVMMQKVRTHSPVAGFFQFSQRPARPNGDRSCMSMAYGCFTFEPLIAIHSKKPSIGTMHRRLRYASRNNGSRSTVSAFGVDRRRLRLVLAPVRDEPPLQQIERALAGLGVLPDYPQLLARRAVVARRHVAERIAGAPVIPRVESIDDFEPEPQCLAHLGGRPAGNSICALRRSEPRPPRRPCLIPEPVMLEFMQPAVAARDAIGKDRLAGRDEAGRDAAPPRRDTGTHQHRPNLCSLRRFGSPCDN